MTDLRFSGFCPICNAEAEFQSDSTWYRDNLFCLSCKPRQSIPRERAVMLALNDIAPDWRLKAIHECSPTFDRGPSVRLMAECQDYTPTHFFKNISLGAYHNGVRCEDLEKQTFKNDSFDIVIAQEVYEHIFSPMNATKEIYRTLKENGVAIITTGIYKNIINTECCAKINDKKQIDYILQPPEYHGNPIDENGSLVTFRFGYDIIDLLAEWAPFNIEIRRYNDRMHGIIGEFTDVIILKKGHPLPADFDPATYLKLNDDVRKAGVNPYFHYQTYGRKEGRRWR